MSDSSFVSTSARFGRRIGMLSTYAPKICGLATFSAALERELRALGNAVEVVRLDDGDWVEPTSRAQPSVVAEIKNGDPFSVRNGGFALSRCDVAIVQHEFGIFGGTDGDEVLDILRAIRVPTIVVLHTVPLAPTSHQRFVLEAVANLADGVVVMTEAARLRLVSTYDVDRNKPVTISHGAIVPDQIAAQAVRSAGHQHPQLLTWGLLGPGKGIEHVVDALAMLREVYLEPRYTVAGVTHPKVMARDGDQYRQMLIRRSRQLGLSASVSFDDTYRSVAALTRFIASSEIVILPYDSRDQATSGVLVDAVAAGRPVIATAFPHAVELLASGAGIVVPQGDPEAMADAIRALTCDHQLLATTAAEARRIAPSLSWSAIAAQYASLADRLLEPVEALAS